MSPDPDAVLRRLTDRLAPLERDLHQALWAAATDARPSTSATRRRAEEAWLAALGDPELFAEVPERVFAPGATLPWRDLVTAATGGPLGPAAFLTGLGT
jgi:hypothetical protein